MSVLRGVIFSGKLHGRVLALKEVSRNFSMAAALNPVSEESIPILTGRSKTPFT